MGIKQQKTKEQALLKLTALCAKSEHCIEDIRQKMRRWDIDDDTQEEILQYLIKERYIDEERYTRAFIRSKFTYNKWGKYKIEQALYAKRISKDIYAPLLADIEDNDFTETLMPLLLNKNKSIKADSDYERRGKLTRFALQRGFSMKQALSCIDKII